MVIWTLEAQDEANDLSLFLARVSPTAAVKLRREFTKRAIYYENMPGVGSPVPGLGPEYRLGYARAQDYKLWYKMLAANNIVILMVRSSKQRPPTIDEIQARG